MKTVFHSIINDLYILGRREGELTRREFEEDAFKKILGVHDSTVGSYLTSVMREENDLTSGSKAKETVIEYATRLNDEIEIMEARYVVFIYN